MKVMSRYEVATPLCSYFATVERGVVDRLSEFLPTASGRIFAISTRDVWGLYGKRVSAGLGSRGCEVLFFDGGEGNKRLSHIERMAEQMVEQGADRSSL